MADKARPIVPPVPHSPMKSMIIKDLKPGTSLRYCTCGLAATQPWCGMFVMRVPQAQLILY